MPKPRRLDKVYDIRKNPEHRNGYIIAILYDDGPDEVIVRFHNRGGEESYDYEVFCGPNNTNWTDKFGGLWMIPNV